MPENNGIYKYLTEQGVSFFIKWGEKLRGLRNGMIIPSSPNEKTFVNTFSSGSKPSGQAEIFWFKIEEIEELERKLRLKEWELEECEAKIQLLQSGMQSQQTKFIDPLKKEIEYLNGIIKKCHGTIANYESQLGITSPDVEAKSGETCPVCKGTGGMGNCRRCDGKGWI
jgi:uncharacterized protein YifE (UPF0438 family)